MTSITRNLPWPIPNLGISIIGQECYTTLIEDLHVTDVPCIKYSLSKGLGIGIVAGGSVMKVPQVYLIVKSRSARGLSLPSFTLETIAYSITLAYSFRNQFPFSTYGETFFLAIQNTLITLLIILYAPVSLTSRRKSRRLSLFFTLTPAIFFTLLFCPFRVLTVLLTLSLPLALLSKFPQIMQNYRSQSTGNLSLFAVLSQILGCLARLFTTATEVGDPLVAAGFFLALVLNAVLGTQMWHYWGKDTIKDEGEMDHQENRGSNSLQSAYELRSRSQSPPLSPASAEGGKHWVRKSYIAVDMV